MESIQKPLRNGNSAIQLNEGTFIAQVKKICVLHWLVNIESAGLSQQGSMAFILNVVLKSNLKIAEIMMAPTLEIDSN